MSLGQGGVGSAGNLEGEKTGGIVYPKEGYTAKKMDVIRK